MKDKREPFLPIRQVAKVFFRLGLLGFGGPLATMSMMEDETTRRRKWVSTQEFNEAYTLCKILPGPAATQMAIYLGYKVSGRMGGIISGAGFILPSFFLVLLLSWLYVHFGTVLHFDSLFHGMQAAALWIVKPRSGAAGFSDRAIDIRVDDHRQPLVELRRLLNIVRSAELIAQANTHLQAGELDAALERATTARDKAPDNDNAWVMLGAVYVKMNRRADALAAVRRAIQLNPANERNLPRNPNFEMLYKGTEETRWDFR